jgi:hypothetical protein
MERILDRYERYLLCEDRDVTEDYPEESQVGEVGILYEYFYVTKSLFNLCGTTVHSLCS